MIIDTAVLGKDQQVFLELQQLYEQYGYRQFSMRKFEEYSLYLENKSFLGSENVIAFNDPSGKLMALKPDVTLSIVKNAKATGKNNEKLYYRESVYRLDAVSREFREINQMGLEFIGDVSEEVTSEICSLAIGSLKAIDKNFIFAMSHIGYIGGLLDETGIKSPKVRNDMLRCIRNKNAHDLKAIAEKNDADTQTTRALCGIVSSKVDFLSALTVARAYTPNAAAKAAVEELERFYESAKTMGLENNIRLDFSIVNDVDYYNGIIFQGFVEGMPKMILSGGRYDRLLEKFKKQVGAMGFALSLSDLAAFYPRKSAEAEND